MLICIGRKKFESVDLACAGRNQTSEYTCFSGDLLNMHPLTSCGDGKRN